MGVGAVIGAFGDPGLEQVRAAAPESALIVLSGFEGATSVTGARPPKTKPINVYTPVARRDDAQPGEHRARRRDLLGSTVCFTR